MYTILRYFIPAAWLIKIIAINEINPIVNFIVNSATCFGLTDQRPADEQ